MHEANQEPKWQKFVLATQAAGFSIRAVWQPKPAASSPLPGRAAAGAMVERLTFRRRHCYATKSNKVQKVKTPGAE